MEAMAETFKEKERMNLMEKEELAAIYREQSIGVSKTD